VDVAFTRFGSLTHVTGARKQRLEKRRTVPSMPGDLFSVGRKPVGLSHMAELGWGQ